MEPPGPGGTTAEPAVSSQLSASSGVISAAVPQADFFYMIDKIYDWFVGTTPVEESTWGEIKGIFR